MEEINKNIEKINEKPKKQEKLEKIQLDKLRGRVIILNPEESEFAKKLNLAKKGDYTQKTK